MSAAPLPFRRPGEPRECAECHARLAADAPSWWRLCQRCFGYAQLSRALRIFSAADKPHA
jgi:hypothetical protein